MVKKILRKYDTISKLIATHRSEYIGLCTHGDIYYVHKRSEIFDFINPLSPYKSALYHNNILCINL